MGLDFSNLSTNIISDLGPLLALFGEQVAKQFMSESTGWADNILFAMAPLGIVTATVGAIRIGGPNWMRAVIGRARENRALSEIELMSSTSHEVCELWNGQQIVRIMGAPPIRELVCVRQDGELPKLFTLKEAKESVLRKKDGDRMKRFPREIGNIISSFLLKLVSYRQKSDCIEELKTPPHGLHDQPLDEAPNINEAPNISLNLNAHISRWEVRFFAVVATFLQASVLIYARFVSSNPSLQAVFQKLGQYDKNLWAVHLTVTGTIAVVIGMLICAFIIEHSTSEEQYQARNPHDRVHIMWLQRSAAVSDQSFDSHVIFGEGSRQIITTSRRNKKFGSPRYDPIFNGLTIAGVVVSLAGFLIQMIGLRGMHWTVAVAQLIATGLITTIRAWVRRGLSAPPHAIPLPLGYEIDWLATRMVHHDNELRDRQKWRPHPTSPEHRKFWEKFGGQGCYNWDILTGVNSPGYTRLLTPREHGGCRVVVDKPGSVATGVEIAANNSQPLEEGIAAAAPNNPQPLSPLVEEDQTTSCSESVTDVEVGVIKGIEIMLKSIGVSANRAQMVHGSRKDLGMLTKWSGPAADKATSVAKAIEIVLKNTQTTEEVAGKVLIWKLHAFTTHMEPIYFEIKHDGKGWKVNVADIEAVLSLWLFAAAEKEKATRSMDDGSDKDAWLRSGEASRRESLRLLGASNRVSRRDMRWWAGCWNNRLIEVSPVNGDENIARETIKLSSHRVVGYGGYSVEENGIGVGGEIWVEAKEPMVYRTHEISSDINGSRPVRLLEGILKQRQGMISASDLDSESEMSNRLASIDEETEYRNSITSDNLWDNQGRVIKNTLDEAEIHRHSLATVSNVPLEAVYAVDIFSAFMWAYVQTPGFKRIEGETTVQPPDRVISGGGETSWQNSTLSRIAEDVSRTGLASVEEVYMSIIPPLSAYRRLPDASAEVEFAKQQAKIYELNSDWKKASRCYLWAMTTCEPFDPSDKAAIYATASLTEYLRTLKTSANIMIQQKYSPKAIRWLLKERDSLVARLCNFSDLQTRRKIADVYRIQGRAEGCEVWSHKGGAKESLVYEPSMPLKFNRIHLAINSGTFGDVRESINRTFLKKRNETRKEVNEKDVLGWTPLHYAVRGKDETIVKNLLKWGADWRVPNLAEWTPLHYAASSKMQLWKLLRVDKVDVNIQGRRGFGPLHCAARGNNLDMAKELVKFGADTNKNDNFRRTSLHWAAYGGFIDIVQFLLQKGANVEASDDLGRTPLHLAAMCGHKEVSELLLTEGAEIDIVDRDGRTAVQIATNGKHTIVLDLLRVRGANMSNRRDGYMSALQIATIDKDVAGVKKLLSAGADVNCKPGRFGSALHAAIGIGHEELVELFLRSEAKMDVVNSKGETITALEVAAETENVGVVKLLISNGADPQNASALNSAARAGHSSVVELLISKGADPNVEDKYGATALQAAAETGQHMIVDFLISKGANPWAGSRSGGTALEVAARMGHDRVIDLLISGDTNMVDTTNKSGETALHTAAREGRKMVVQRLLELGASVNFQGKNGQTALHIAARQAKETIVELLLENGADPTVKDINDETAIQMAGRSGNETIAKMLLVKRTNDTADATDKNGGVALQVAARAGNEEVVKVLLSGGVTVDFQDKSGETALQAASGEGHHEVVKLLLSARANIDLQDNKGRTALHAAAKAGHSLVLILLLAGGIKVNTADYEGKTALLLAAAAGYKDVVQTLVIKSANIDLRDKEGQTALIAAAAEGHECVVSVILGYDRHIEQDVYTALELAVDGGHEGVAEQLLNAKVVDMAKDAKLLERAVLTGNEKLVQLLLDYDADVNTQGGEYGSALQAAITPNGAENLPVLAVIDILLNARADINAHSDKHCSALQRAALEGYTEAVQLLLDNGADTNVQGCADALQSAVSRGNTDIVQLLLNFGADVNAKGGTALQAAAASRNVEMAQLLLENGADVNTPGYGSTDNALQVAACSGDTEVVRLILSYGADVNASGVDHGTALMQAAKNGYVEVVRMLLEAGADLGAGGGGFGSALAQAAGNGCVEVVQLLIEKGADVNADGGENGSALMRAARNGYLDVVQLLLDKRAVDNVDAGGYKSALVQAAKAGLVDLVQAAKSGYKELVRILLENGAADVDVLSARRVAEENGDKRVLGLLSEHGAK